MRIRWLWIVLVFFTIVVARNILHLNLPLVPLFVLLFLLTSYNAAMALIIARSSEEQLTPRGRNLLRWQLMLDFVLLALFLHFSGGIENPFGIYFIFHVIGSSLLLERAYAFLQTAIGVFLYVLIVVLEYFGVIPHYAIFHAANVPLCQNTVYILADVTALATALFFAAFMATTISQEMRERDRELERYNKLLLDQDRKKSEYVLMISHDLQEPIATIQNCLELVLQGYSGQVDEEAAKTLRRASQWSRRMIYYVRDLLRLSRLKTLTSESLQPVCLNEIVQGVLSEYQQELHGKSLQLLSSVPDEELCILGDAENLRHLVSNLLANAIKYTPENGTIGVDLRREQDRVVLEVWDTGIGISQEHQEKIFDEFFRAPEAVKADPAGTGLGLAIVKRIVDLHNAEISVVSPHNKHPQLVGGACFTITFPLPDEKIIEEEKSSKATLKKGEERKMPEKKRILIIDDNPDLVANSRIVLESRGYEVYDAPDGDRGLEMIKEVKPHLIILDIMMKSETEGFHVAYKLRSEAPEAEMAEFRNIPILVMSSIHEKTAYRFDEAVGSEWLPVDEFVDKPVSPEELIKRVEAMIGPSE